MTTPASTSPAAPRSTCLMRQASIALAFAACDLSSGDDEPPGDPVACPLNDAWEPNDDLDRPTAVPWDSADAWSVYHEVDDAYLCPGEDDWYRFDGADLGDTARHLHVRALIKNAGLCGAACGEPVIPAGPEHAMTIEIYRADTREPLTAQTADGGVLALGGRGDAYAHALLLRVHSDTRGAEYPYRLLVDLRSDEGEDECEC